MAAVVIGTAALAGCDRHDAVSAALPLAEQGQHRKKALLVISDGNDTSSQVGVRELRQQIRESEVLVYAIGIDGDEESVVRRVPRTQPAPPRIPMPLPLPFPLEWPDPNLRMRKRSSALIWQSAKQRLSRIIGSTGWPFSSATITMYGLSEQGCTHFMGTAACRSS